ncbi:MAG: sodium:proton antiporter [Candidatus Omnitrophota bacterium]|nr:sodium:proton antiporter [Candidatus Omnitrophota bacterium]MBU1929285.1 sodium:proton antiporter [Candidatus Omnitrophota bacterium]MBU2035577.1 sodium:proton antiporter [Candidatus Omnitrophota bacterium]MBU2222116.1 sodium:proton antiporter [Candidatus Omnitrophota bacterium]MBU2258358.1 sodium:proton antiporter [Candidatus Omnitrophota bacterium]
MSLYLLCLLLFCVGFYGILRKRNLVKMIIGLGIMEYSMNLFFVLLGYRMQGRSPIEAMDQNVLNMVDPLPQALVLTSIIIGLGVTALVISIAIRIYDKYGTFDITKINKLRG